MYFNPNLGSFFPLSPGPLQVIKKKTFLISPKGNQKEDSKMKQLVKYSSASLGNT